MIRTVVKYFFVWRVIIFVLIFVSTQLVPLQNNYLGGGKSVYLQNPIFWSHLNFDGEHYLSIAQRGYQPLEYFFFPLYPMAVRFLNIFPDKNLFSLALNSLIISNTFFLLSLVGIYKLFKEEEGEHIAKKTILLMLLFPTSFFFITAYTESLFLFLSVWSFYLMKAKKWPAASVLAGLLSATRIVGIVVVPAMLIEFLNSKSNKLKAAWLLISPLGLVTYMYYLYVKTGDIFSFQKNIEIFGEQRSSSIVILPQVIYRYLFKIIPNSFTYLPMTFTVILEFTVGLSFLFLCLYAFKKLKLSYAVFCFMGYIIPTFSGSFSSMPRYVIVLFPIFLLLAKISEKNEKIYYALCFVFALTNAFALMLFSRGYWIS